MFDVWLGDVNLTLAVLAISLAVVLPAQLLLCFYARRRILRLAPALFFAAAGAACAWRAAAGQGTERLGWLLLAIYAAVLLAVSLAAWAVSSVVRMMRRWDERAEDEKPD